MKRNVLIYFTTSNQDGNWEFKINWPVTARDFVNIRMHIEKEIGVRAVVIANMMLLADDEAKNET